ncbi:MAG: RimJ/RimL family protein N-acetyltransferase, partial [Streptomyces sp.]|nr:RimJ/RimL family protein N-acetyltransferase [Streptomyces sp.]
MYAISLGDDGAELRPLDPWHAEEFLAHLDRGREFITQHIPFGSNATDVDSARALLQSYADRHATDS